MRALLLKDETTITTVKECGEAFFTWHKIQADANANLNTIKAAIKENDAIAWFKHGISVDRNKTNDLFDKDEAKKIIKELSKKLGYSENKTAKLLARCIKKSSPFVTISKAK